MIIKNLTKHCISINWAKRFGLVSALFLLGIHVYAQTLQYDVLIENNKVGKMTVTKSTFVGGGIIIDMESSFDVEMLGKSKISMYSTTYFKKDVMTDAESVLERNGRVREQCLVNYDKTKYRIQRKNEKEVFLSGIIKFSVAKMYMEEPKGIFLVFSERYGDQCNLLDLGGGVYELKLPTGNVMKYHYKGGICVLSESTGSMQDVTIKLKQK